MRQSNIMAVLAGVQTGVGVPATLSEATNAIEAAGITSNPYQGNSVQSNVIKTALGNQISVRVGEHSIISMEVELNGSGTPDLAPAFGVLLRGCALRELIDSTPGSESVKYDYVDSTDGNIAEYLTIECYLDGEKHRLENARGKVSFGFNAQSLPVAKFEFIGDYIKPVFLASFPSFNYALFKDAIPLSKDNTPVFKFFGYEAAMSSLDIDIGLEQTYRNLVNLKGHAYTDRKGSGSCTFDSPELDVKDFYAAWESHQGITTGPLELQHGTQGGEIILMNAIKLQLTELSRADSDGVMQYNANFNMLSTDAGDDEFSITFK